MINRRTILWFFSVVVGVFYLIRVEYDLFTLLGLLVLGVGIYLDSFLGVGILLCFLWLAVIPSLIDPSGRQIYPGLYRQTVLLVFTILGVLLGNIIGLLIDTQTNTSPPRWKTRLAITGLILGIGFGIFMFIASIG